MVSAGFRCVLPLSVTRGGGEQGGGQIRYALPMTITRAESVRESARSYILGQSGLTCRLPHQQSRAGGPEGGRLAMPQGLARAASAAPMPDPAPQTATPPSQPGPTDPGPAPDPSQSNARAARPRRTQPSLDALFPILERVARGISGAAGYAYMGEDPEGAGLRYGLLGLRLDTGDMGAALRLAHGRDPDAFAAALGEGADALLDTANAATPDARKAPVAGAALWSPDWKALLSRTAGRDIFRAAQNEYGVDHLLMPAADMVLAMPGLASGTALAMALDVLAETGREDGLVALRGALSTGTDTPAALKTALIAACPACRLRLEDLARDKALADWRPAEAS